ncbi:MAG: ATP-binding protein [Pelodictyon phaeoclathratiforme]
MNLLQLMDLVASGEDGSRQFKSDIRNAESLASEMAAFANAEGGVILIGVADNGRALKALMFRASTRLSAMPPAIWYVVRLRYRLKIFSLRIETLSLFLPYPKESINPISIKTVLSGSNVALTSDESIQKKNYDDCFRYPISFTLMNFQQKQELTLLISFVSGIFLKQPINRTIPTPMKS